MTKLCILLISVSSLLVVAETINPDWVWPDQFERLKAGGEQDGGGAAPVGRSQEEPSSDNDTGDNGPAASVGSDQNEQQLPATDTINPDWVWPDQFETLKAGEQSNVAENDGGYPVNSEDSGQQDQNSSSDDNGGVPDLTGKQPFHDEGDEVSGLEEQTPAPGDDANTNANEGPDQSSTDEEPPNNPEGGSNDNSLDGDLPTGDDASQDNPDIDIR